MASTISEKEKNLHHIPAGFEHSYLFFAQEIDIQSSLKVNLIIVYYSAQYKSCGNELPCLFKKLTFPIWPVV